MTAAASSFPDERGRTHNTAPSATTEATPTMIAMSSWFGSPATAMHALYPAATAREVMIQAGIAVSDCPATTQKTRNDPAKLESRTAAAFSERPCHSAI